MTLDLSPRPGAVPLPRMIVQHAAMELRLLLRNGEQLGVTLVIPLLVLVAGSVSAEVIDLGERPLDLLTPGVLALAVLSSAFTSLAIATGFERRYGVLKRLGASPLPRGGLLAGKMLAVLVTQIAQLVILSAVALLLGWSPSGGPSALVWTAVFVVCGSATFSALAMLIAGTLRAEATLAVANLVYVLLLVGGAVLIPLDRYPDGAAQLVALLPSSALGEGLREALNGETPSLAALAVLIIWVVAAGAAAIRWFKWE